MMMLNRLLAFVLLAGLVLASAPVPAAGEPYDFYAILSLTGPGAFLGNGESAALRVAESYVNATGGIKGRAIRFVVQDDASNPATAVSLFNQIAVKRPAAIIGPSLAATCSALGPLVGNGPVLFCLTNAVHPANGSYTFSANLSSKDFTAAELRYVKAKGLRKLAVLATTDATGQDNEAVALENVRSPEFRDMQIVADEHFAVADLNVTAQIARIKAAGAQVVFAATTGPPFGTVLRSLQDAGYDGTVMTGGGNVNKTQMLQYASFVPKDLIFSGQPFANVGILPSRVRLAKVTFLDRMRQAGIAEPDPTNLIAWDPMLVLVDGLRHVGPGASAAQLKAYIEQLHDFAGINGMYDFRRGDQRGIDPKSSPVVRWDKGAGEFVTISRPGGLPL